MASVWYEGIEDLYRVAADLGAAGPKARATATLVINKTAADIERDAKAIAPVDTGNLKNSISRTKATAANLAAEVGPTASYGSYVEFGTEGRDTDDGPVGGMDPQPYMGPAWDSHIEAFTAAMAAIAAAPL